jgi:hypothetical protein
MLSAVTLAIAASTQLHLILQCTMQAVASMHLLTT